MRKVLVIGCGGSGAKTLSYMMDQLRADLAVHGVEEITMTEEEEYFPPPRNLRDLLAVIDLLATYTVGGPVEDRVAVNERAVAAADALAEL